MRKECKLPGASVRHTVSGMFGQIEQHVLSSFLRSAQQLGLTWLQLQYLFHLESSRVRSNLSLLLQKRLEILQKLKFIMCIMQW